MAGILLLNACAGAPVPESQSPAVAAVNPLFSRSTLPYQMPAFDQIKDAHYRPAFDKGMAEHLAEMQAIAANP